MMLHNTYKCQQHVSTYSGSQFLPWMNSIPWSSVLRLDDSVVINSVGFRKPFPLPQWSTVDLTIRGDMGWPLSSMVALHSPYMDSEFIFFSDFLRVSQGHLGPTTSEIQNSWGTVPSHFTGSHCPMSSTSWMSRASELCPVGAWKISIITRASIAGFSASLAPNDRNGIYNISVSLTLVG